MEAICPHIFKTVSGVLDMGGMVNIKSKKNGKEKEEKKSENLFMLTL